MRIHRTSRENAIWTILAFIGGCAVGWIDVSATTAQATVVILMVVSFALTLPGRAPVVGVSVGSALGIPMAHVLAGRGFDVRFLIAMVPAFVAAGGGRLAGTLLDTAASNLDDRAVASPAPWNEKPLSRRFILAVALVLIAAIGLPITNIVLGSLEHPAHAWLALVWQIMTLLGWIGLTPIVLRVRGNASSTAEDIAAAPRPIDVIRTIGLLIGLITLHAVIIVALTGALFIPIVPSSRVMMVAALTIYAPLDVLAYLAIVALAYVSDVDRHRRDGERREHALRMETLDSRLTALRARLNPHFLFNALNSVHTLARGGKTDETARAIEGLTSLLRYVLDERRSIVPLGDELAFVREYLDVQRVRFGARLRYEIDCDPRLATASIPQLLLQPLVENAVEHGVARALDGGSVRVRAAREGSRLRLTVEDDEPSARDETPSSQSSGIGLSSTRERLARLYDGRATLAFERSPGSHGSRVRVDIPFERFSTNGT